MGKPLKVVVIGDSQNTALRCAAELEQCGFEPTFRLASTDAELRRRGGVGCDLVGASRAPTALSPERALAVLRVGGHHRPVLVWADGYSEEEVVSLVRAGARDCVRKGNLRRLKAAVEQEVESPAASPQGLPVDPAADRYRALIEEIPALTYVAWADETGSRAYVSPQLLAMTGFGPGEWLAEPDMWARRLHPQDRERVLRQFQEAYISTGRFSSEYRILDREGRVVWWRDEGRVIPDPEGRARFVRGFVLDITEQKLGEERLRHLRYFDQLTGLPNRLQMQRRLGRDLAEAARSHRSLAVLILALDRFRETASTLGPHNGDLIICDVAKRLGDVLGDSDRVARLRGDEFGALLPDAEGALAVQVGESMLAALEKPFLLPGLPGLPIEVGASVGIAVAPQHGEEAEVLLRRADIAVQKARKLGGACLLYSEEHEPHDPRQLALLAELRQAMEANQLRLHYQPKVDLKTRSVVGAEALLRWPHPKRGLVAPGDFIPLAENTGLIRPLTRWVISRAAQEAKMFERGGRPLPIAVNVSHRNLHDLRLLDDFGSALAEHGLPAERMQVEVTESAVMADPVRAGEVLQRLSGRGVRISLDDFGTGLSSLAMLRRLPVTELKIDGSFVRGMVGDGAEDTAIVRMASELGHNLGYSVVAEGVEDQWTLDILGTFGCDQAQGFYIARPMAAGELVHWLGQGSWKVAGS
jgi:diguanylate cyclase (GGDEF)-like protein/PAS domain S-box-containing protein